MFTKSYNQTIKHLGEISPTLSRPTDFIKWAEDVAEVLMFIYSVDYDKATEDITESAKESQDYTD